MKTGFSSGSKVSVVVLTYNRHEELARTLQRLHDLPERPHVIVVDNGSLQHSAEHVLKPFARVELVKSQQNLGAAGRNLGVDRVRTPYVAFADDDTWWAPGSLRRATDILDALPNIDVLNASIVVGPDERPDPACVTMATSPLEYVAGVGPMLIGFMAGANIMRTEAYRKAGGYWPPFFIGGEESLLALDILDAGGRIVYAPELRLHHWPSDLRDSALRRLLLARNAIWTAWLRLPADLAWRRSRLTLRSAHPQTPRSKVLAHAWRGAGLIHANRHVITPQTCELLERVWRHEGQ